MMYYSHPLTETRSRNRVVKRNAWQYGNVDSLALKTFVSKHCYIPKVFYRVKKP